MGGKHSQRTMYDLNALKVTILIMIIQGRLLINIFVLTHASYDTSVSLMYIKFDPHCTLFKLIVSKHELSPGWCGSVD